MFENESDSSVSARKSIVKPFKRKHLKVRRVALGLLNTL